MVYNSSLEKKYGKNYTAQYYFKQQKIQQKSYEKQLAITIVSSSLIQSTLKDCLRTDRQNKIPRSLALVLLYKSLTQYTQENRQEWRDEDSILTTKKIKVITWKSRLSVAQRSKNHFKDSKSHPFLRTSQEETSPVLPRPFLTQITKLGE